MSSSEPVVNHRASFSFPMSGVLLGVMLLTWVIFMIDQNVLAADRPAGPLHKTRSAVIARQGMAATSQPLATATAIQMLQKGGNAVDAAIAANAVLGVVEPMSCGIGGDLFAIVWDAKTKRLYGLNASGRAPAAATIDVFKSKGLTHIPTYGPLSWSVPGCVDGWDHLWKRFGTKSWSELLAPAISYAGAGFPVSEIIAADWHTSEEVLKAIPTSAACYLPGGHAPAKGAVFYNAGLARSLGAIAKGGRDAFYRGPLADAIVHYSQSAGGLFAHSDFAEHTGNFVDPVSTNYRGYDVWELPPNGQGIAAPPDAQLARAIRPEEHGPAVGRSPSLDDRGQEAGLRRSSQILRRPRVFAPADRRADLEALCRRASKSAEPRARNPDPTPGEPAQADTIYMTVVDKDFNCVSLIQSNFHGFGSHHVPGDLGFVLQNRGCQFALDPHHLNRLEPRKRPFHTIIPAFITKGGQPWLSFGLMGGDMQAQGHAQVVCDLIDFGMDVQEAGDAPRFRHFGSSEPTGTPAAPGGGSVALESGISAETRRQLEAKGHRIVDSPGGFGGYQAIRIDLERGVLIGGSDPRKDGCALGY